MTTLWKAAVIAGHIAVLASSCPAEATEYVDIGLHRRVLMSDTIVVARVADPARAQVVVERVLKGNPSKQMTLVDFVDGFAAPEHRKALVLGSRELLLLTKRGDANAPVQTQYGRMAVNGNRLIDGFRAEPRGLSQTIASIERLVTFQARAARGDSEADAAFAAALRTADDELQLWALWDGKERIKKPSAALVDALLACWPKNVGPVYGAWNNAGLVANAVVTWRIQRAAPLFANILTTSRNGDERAWAAMALGGWSSTIQSRVGLLLRAN